MGRAAGGGGRRASNRPGGRPTILSAAVTGQPEQLPPGQGLPVAGLTGRPRAAATGRLSRSRSAASMTGSVRAAQDRVTVPQAARPISESSPASLVGLGPAALCRRRRLRLRLTAGPTQ